MEQTKAAENLSQWFSLDQQKPWEPGVYEVEFYGYTRDSDSAFAFWNGYKFLQPCVIGFNYVEQSKSWENNSGHKVYAWRGLASDPSAKPKPKARGNRRVTRYVVMVGYGFQSTYPAATFESKENAMAYIAHQEKSCRYETIYIDEIRFRTPEAT